MCKLLMEKIVWFPSKITRMRREEHVEKYFKVHQLVL